jgi:hypothetical protein
MVKVPFLVSPDLLLVVPTVIVPEPLPVTVNGPALPFKTIQG